MLEDTGKQAEHLADYGIAGSDIAAARSALNTATAHLPKTREGISIRTAAANKVKTITAESRMITERLDRLMLQQRRAQPAFFDTYMAARKIVESGSRHPTGFGIAGERPDRQWYFTQSFSSGIATTFPRSVKEQKRLANV